MVDSSVDKCSPCNAVCPEKLEEHLTLTFLYCKRSRRNSDSILVCLSRILLQLASQLYNRLCRIQKLESVIIQTRGGEGQNRDKNGANVPQGCDQPKVFNDIKLWLQSDLSDLQECLEKFSRKLSIILDAQGVSLSAHLPICLYVNFIHSHSSYQAQCVVERGCSLLSNTVTFTGYLTEIDLSLSLFPLLGSDWNHTEVSQDEAADLCEGVSVYAGFLVCVL